MAKTKPQLNENFKSEMAKTLSGLFSGHSQQQVANSLGVSAQAVNGWLQGTCPPGIPMLMKISAVYGVSVDYLLGLSKQKSVDGNLAGASAYTGLSEEAVESVRDIANGFSDLSYRHDPDFISRLFSSESFKKLIVGFISMDAHADYLNEVASIRPDDLRDEEAEALRSGRLNLVEASINLSQSLRDAQNEFFDYDALTARAKENYSARSQRLELQAEEEKHILKFENDLKNLIAALPGDDDIEHDEQISFFDEK